MGDENYPARKYRKLDTNGCCFLCLKVTQFKTEEDEDVGDNNLEVLAPEIKSVSLKSLRRYLKISTERLPAIRKPSSSSVNIKEDSGNDDKPTTLKMEEEEDIVVDLCKSCAAIVNKFSKVFSTLEMIQLEINHWLEKIHKRIPGGKNANDLELVQNYCRRMTRDAEKRDGFIFIDELRKEIATKSGSKLQTSFEVKVKLDHAKIWKKPSTLTTMNSGIDTLTQDTSSSHPQLEDEFECEDEDVKHVPPSPVTENEVEEDESNNDQIKMKTEDSIDVKPSSRRHRARTKKASSLSSSSSSDKKATQNKQFYIYSSKTGKYSCTECSKKLATTRSALNHYYSIHLKIKRAICERCGSGFYSKGDLQHHEKYVCGNRPVVTKYVIISSSSTGIDKYKCTKCGRENDTKAAAGTHYNQVHLNNRKYKCEVCNVAAFYAQKRLDKHKLNCQINLDKEKFNKIDSRKKWPCPVCGKRFSRRNDMNNHQSIVHLKDRNHQCDLCEKRYSSEQILRDHKRVAHFRKEVYCKFCTRCYAYGKTFLAHQRKCGKKKAEEDNKLMI